MPLWTAAMDPHVLRAVTVAGDDGACAFDVRDWPHCAVRTGECLHVSVGLPCGMLRLDITGGDAFTRQVAVEPLIDLDRDLVAQFEAVRRLDAAMRGTPPAACDPRLGRLIEALRVVDALAGSASLRDIGLALSGASDWPGDGEHVKSRARRRVTLAAALVRAGYRGVLAAEI